MRAPLAILAVLILGCTTVSSSRPLSGEPARPTPAGIYLFGEAPRAPYRTVAFVQIGTRGSGLRGSENLSDTELDPVLHGLLARAIHDAGAEAAILVDWADVDPPMPATRPWSAERGPPGRVRTRARRLEVQAELIVFERGESR